MRSHAHYEELCGLASTRQLPENEASEFRIHLAECSACRLLVEDFAETGAFLATNHSATCRLMTTPPDGMTQRFIARARSEGVSISHGIASNKRRAFLNRKLVFGAAVAASLLMSIFVLRRTEFSRTLSQKAAPAIVRSGTKLPPTGAPLGLLDQTNALNHQLSETRAKIQAIRLRISSDQANLRQKQGVIAALQEELRATQAENSRLKTANTAQTNDLAQLQAEIDKLNSVGNASEIALSADENELRRLRQEVTEKEAAMERQEQLIQAGIQARDLIVARNLHIIDVYDRDANGNKQRAFGRIFYTEGKSLVFYAYDLTTPATVEKEVSFYAWGEKMGNEQPVRRLGIFHNEDIEDGRWVLTFDDPHVLAQINSVFVTVEQKKDAVTRPRGKRILFAFLGSKANHP